MATAVPAERDAVAGAFPAPVREVRHPGALLHRTSVGVDLLAAGVGPALAAASTAAALTAAALAGTPYALVVCAGIAGGFLPDAPVGSLVVADEITVADLGAETADGFLPVTELGFGTVTHRPPGPLLRRAAAATGARTGTVLTVSTVTGTAARAAALRARHPRALAEAMEGFGVAEAAAAHGVPVLEVRAVSNPVGPRDRAAWRIPDALAALTEAFAKLAPVLENPGIPKIPEIPENPENPENPGALEVPENPEPPEIRPGEPGEPAELGKPGEPGEVEPA
ncbi:Futalosine hydrolase [Streptomyces echinoruber]|uniref:Futalosine hydrolase n=1 Tax=Streptomyces echinoruber TaxID=68898 RepID=A0A918VG67_9ACTN|nr:Futalosine hydrolase [Streptomyces echinoruber]